MTTGLFGQDDSCADLSKKELKRLGLVEQHVNKKEFAKALNSLLPLYDKHPTCLDVLYFYGLIAYHYEDREKAISSFNKIYNTKPDYQKTISYAIGKLYFDESDYEKAMEPLEYFIDHYPESHYAHYAEEYISLSRQRLHILSDTLTQFTPYRLPAGVNTDLPEYFPALSVDNKSLIFTRRVAGQEDIYISQLDSLGQWQAATPMTSMNTPDGNEGGHTISADGRVFIFTACRTRGTYGGCDLFISYRDSEGKWSAAQNMGPDINTAAWEAQPSLSPDKNILYFTSNRDGKKSKIYYALLQEDGSYGNVQRIGKPIDSPGNDWAPFIAYDNETLYFSSDGHPGLGNRDLFLSRKDSLGNWSQPINLGPPLNTAKEEGTIFINSTATKGYITSDKDGSLDIYEFQPDSSIAPKAVTYVEGYVYDSTSHEKLLADISVLRLRDSTVIGRFRSSRDGYYLAVLPMGEKYAFWVEKENYLFHSSHHTLTGSHGIHAPMTIDIPLIAIKDIEGSTGIILRNILYEIASSKLLPDAYPELNKLLDFMEENPGINIHIIGHTDDVGTAEDNQTLSEDRARSVVNYLIAHGIEASRLSSEGKGKSQALVPNDSEENRAINRRTEVRILNPERIRNTD